MHRIRYNNQASKCMELKDEIFKSKYRNVRENNRVKIFLHCQPALAAPTVHLTLDNL